MNKHGWQGFPGQEILERWEWWQMIHPYLECINVRGESAVTDCAFEGDELAGTLWRPVCPGTKEEPDWTHYPWCWAKALGEELVPTEQDIGRLWLRVVGDKIELVLIGTHSGKAEFQLVEPRSSWCKVERDGKWFGPYINPDVHEILRGKL